MFSKNNFKITLHYDNSEKATKYNLIKFFKSLGLTVKTTTKARGNRGIYTKNRIDISKDMSSQDAVPILVHEFAHHIHYKLEGDKLSLGGKLERLFNTQDTELIQKELLILTQTTDYQIHEKTLKDMKSNSTEIIRKLQSAIQKDYPKFLRSKPFKEFDNYVKHSSAKYLLKYDRVKIKEGFFFPKTKIISINTLDTDFPEMPKAFKLYLQLKSQQRQQTKTSRRANSMEKYYMKPTELFARFVQSYFVSPENTKTIAPITTARFETLLSQGYYFELKDLIELFSKKNF